MKAVVEPHYLPSLEFFSALIPCDEIILEVNEYFEKQTYRNRCYINTANGKLMLTIPLENRHGKIYTKDVKVEPGLKWRNNHWRAIESAYRKAPFFEYYSDELKQILYSNHHLLFDLNKDLLSFCLRHIGFRKTISETVTYNKVLEENIFDLRSVISLKKPFAERQLYKPQEYYQIFGNEFVPNLSLIDLLFCEGPSAKQVIATSKSLLNE
ncbi:MAG: WbqC family protein [Cyclobacteriaceae bacterium]